MPEIVWEGNRKEWGLPHDGEPLHENAVRIKTAGNVFRDSIPYGIPPMLICFLAVFLKAFPSARVSDRNDSRITAA